MSEHDNNEVMSGVAGRYEGFDSLERAYPPLDAHANFKTAPQDFIVDEVLPFELSGTGEHAWLHIEKENENTQWVAKRIAEVAGVRARAVGFAGLKDRMGITSQWFSVQLPGMPDPDWSALSSETIRIKEVMRHGRKLRRGALKSNHFSIRLRGFEGGRDAVIERLETIASHGVPNYFGQQRFGHDAENLGAAERMFASDERVPKHLKSIYLSAARSWLFNQVLSSRIASGTWDQRLMGDAFMIEGRTACFRDDASQDLVQRLESGEIHPTGVLWGIGEQLVSDEVEALERAIVDRYPVLRDGLETFKLDRRRRALRVRPTDLTWGFEDDDLRLSFSLPSGSYATMVLRELLET